MTTKRKSLLEYCSGTIYEKEPGCMFKCRFCSIGVPRKEIGDHERSAEHARNALVKLAPVHSLVHCYDQTKPIVKRMKAANESPDMLHSLIGQAFLSDTDKEPLFMEIENAVHHAECRERIRLVELAAWKHVCVRTFPSTIYTLIGVMEWQKQGWKSETSKLFRCNDVVVILDRVTPFLQWS
mmetsp:Transcript_4668/g.13042  ORF Transcript_4668/g.13042 Transcript_4668/m.13042 type:complete len:182 (-) Transcript_4668:1451-1996(-)